MDKTIKGVYKTALLIEVYPLTQEGNCDLGNLLAKDYSDNYESIQ
jgi:hypothetical protein